MNKKRVLALFVMLQVVFTSMFPAPAYAVTYQPNVHEFWGVSDFWAVNGVSNRFDAALGLIGEWGKKIQISNANYVALSNEGSGGAFYELAQLLQNAPGQWEPGPDLGMNPIATIAWAGLYTDTQINYGDPTTWLWYCYASDANIADARRDFNKVLAGESLGGGGGSGGGGFSGFSGALPFVTGLEVANTGFNMVLEGDAVTRINALMSGDYKYISYGMYGVGTDSNPARTMNFFVWLSDKPYTVSVESSGQFVIHCSESFRMVMCSAFDTAYSYETVEGVRKGVWTATSRSSFPFTSAITRNDGDVLNYSVKTLYGYINASGGSGGDNHWPEPTTPEPDPPTTNPEPDPEPPDPPTYDPPIYNPPGFSPDVPVTIVPPENTTAADYTPWLRAILTALNTIIDDLGEHCDHIRTAIRDYLSGFYDALSDDLQAYYDDLTDYLSDLAKWIVSHLNFDVKQPDVNVNVPGYDDSSVVGWLRRIYYKLGGSGSPKPDPIEDTDGALDWWAKFLEWITNALGGLLTDFVGDLGEFLQELIDTFPFSIPWDIVAMLTLLDAQRATPDFTVTIPAQEGWWDDITVRIELSAYNDAMATVRGMVMIWWMYILVMKTDWMMLLFDGANDAIADFVSRLTGKG